MITVRRSETGSFVLVHEPSQVVIVGDDLDATYARMQEHLRADPSLSRGVPDVPGAAATRRSAWLVGVGVVALLPFLWLAVLHYTLGRLLEDLRDQPAAEPTEDVQALRAELEALRQVVSRVEDQSGQERRGEPVGGRMGKARRPAEQGVVVVEQAKGPVEANGGDDEGTGGGSGTDDGGDESGEP
jgi:hypothetical protein